MVAREMDIKRICQSCCFARIEQHQGQKMVDRNGRSEEDLSREIGNAENAQAISIYKLFTAWERPKLVKWTVQRGVKNMWTL